MQHRTTERCSLRNRNFGKFVFEQHLLDVCLSDKRLPYKFFEIFQKNEITRNKPGSSRTRKFKQIMCQNHLLDVPLGDNNFPHIVF